MNPATLVEENRTYRGTGGRSQENRGSGFQAAFRDADTGLSYLSRFADGRIAPVHLLDGLPASLVLARDAAGRVLAVKVSLESGFLRQGCFYTRDEALSALAALDAADTAPAASATP